MGERITCDNLTDWTAQVAAWARGGDPARTVVWVPTMAARGALIRRLLADGAVGILPRVIVPMADAVGMQEFGIGQDLWAREADTWAAREVVGSALLRADAGLGGAALARGVTSVLKLLEDVALAGRERHDIWTSVPDEVAQHFMDAAEVLRGAVADYDAWVGRGGVDVAALAAQRWQVLARLEGWRQAAVPLGWQAAAVRAWVDAVEAGEGNMVVAWEAREVGAEERVVVEALTPAEEARAVRHIAQEAVREGRVPVAVAVGDAALGELIAAELAVAGLTPKGGWGATAAETGLGKLAVAVARAAAQMDGIVLADVGAAWAGVKPEVVAGLGVLEQFVWRGVGARDAKGWGWRVARRTEAEVLPLKEALVASGIFEAPERAKLASWAEWIARVMQALAPGVEDGFLQRVLEAWKAAPGGWLVPAGVMAAWMDEALGAMAVGGAAPADAPVLTGRLGALAGAKTLIVSGMNAEQWVPVRPHPFLSARQLGRLGIPGTREALVLAAEEWPLLWGGLGAERVIVTRAKHGLDGGEMALASPWLALRDETEKAVWQAWMARGASYLMWQRGGAVAERVRAPSALGVGNVTVFSPSLVEDALACPYKAAAGRVAGVRAWDDFGALPDARALGLVLHGVIEAFWLAWGREVVLAAERGGALSLLQDEAERALGKEDPTLVQLWRPRVAVLLPALVDGWIDDGVAGWRVAGIERTLEGTVGGVAVKAKADRVDEGAAGIRLVDYKTGRVPETKEIRSGAKPQMALEGAVVAAGATVAELAYVRLRGFGKKTVDVHPVEEMAEAVAAAPDGMARLADSLHEAWVAVPDLSKGGLEAAGHCTHCAFAGWCRFEERNAEDVA